MSDQQQPATLGELLRTLEKSDNLRQLARECGLTPGDLKKRLKQWRRDLETDAAPSSAPVRRAAAEETLSEEAASLLPAAGLGESPLPARGEQVLEIWTDGASRGNPGPASIGIVFGQHGGEKLCCHAEKIGRATNNAAEYQAVLRALLFVRDWGVRRVLLNLDSELVARQLSGQYRVKSQDLLPFYRQVISLMRSLDKVTIRHVRRDHNKLADRLANLALDNKI
ncbi:ribonuclease HI family protein [bacterium]|nr:ribonuclease HI family protein [bacterium]MBU1073472.1 ribonuclease HI family protein [bacterium]MBU1674865.1 ribonuclease HI family protein [bacterium]